MREDFQKSPYVKIFDSAYTTIESLRKKLLRLIYLKTYIQAQFLIHNIIGSLIPGVRLGTLKAKKNDKIKLT